uniref:Uncharacterized protein n=1 Tax=Panagrolaimus davidi TaxID=227884 RepID=A0A914PB71_9BILA
MKTVFIVLVLGVFVTQMLNAKSMPHFDPESEESHEAETELAEIKHDLIALEKRFLELGLHEDNEDKPVNQMSRREKEINKKSLGDIVKWFGKNVIG